MQNAQSSVSSSSSTSMASPLERFASTRARSFDSVFWSFLSSPLRACFSVLRTDFSIDRIVSRPGLGQRNMSLARIMVRGFLVEETLRLQPVDGFGDRRRAYPQAHRELTGRLSVLLAQRQHDLVLPGVESVRQKPGRQRGAGQPRRGVQPGHRRAFVRLGHVEPLGQAGAMITLAARCPPPGNIARKDPLPASNSVAATLMTELFDSQMTNELPQYFCPGTRSGPIVSAGMRSRQGA